MTAAAIKEHVHFFRDFIKLCLKLQWPDNDTEPEQIRNILEAARHVEICVHKMKNERNCFDKFLDLLNKDQIFSKVFLQNCLGHPSKFVLKKIINSECYKNHISVALQNYQDLFSEDRLMESLSDLMVEAASTETLLRNMSSVLTPDKVQQLNNQIYVFVILECDSDDVIVDILKDCDQEMIDTLILCLINDNMVGLIEDDKKSVKRKIITGFTNVMSCRDCSAKQFWALLFSVDKEILIGMCLKYKTLCEMAFDALKDAYTQIHNDLPDESYYIQLTENQLHSILSKIFDSGTLKYKFRDYVKDYEYDDRCLQDLLEL